MGSPQSKDTTARRATLEDLLRRRAAEAHSHSHPARGLLFYPAGNTSAPTSLSYAELYAAASRNARVVGALPSFREGGAVLLHLHDHQDTVLWFWSVRLAKGLPVLSTPFSNVDEYRRKHIQALSALLEAPICITRAGALPLFEGSEHALRLYTVEALLEEEQRQREQAAAQEEEASLTNGRHHPHHHGNAQDGMINPGDASEDLAMLMLTSGSTGNAKAVCLTHRMVLSSVAGKSGACALPADRPFLNWVGLDHVGALVEIHLHALWAGADQVHVAAADVVASPPLFLDLLSRHRVSRSFAPNFFLASLVSAVEGGGGGGGGGEKGAKDGGGSCQWDLSSLRFLVSGGEANDMQTCVRASALLERHGAPRGVVAPGFGMTETCAGCIYNTRCPDYDLARGYAVASLGRCIAGMEMRVTTTAPEEGEEGEEQQQPGKGGRRNARPGEPGDLEVRGAMVFRAYYRNAAATEQAFTPDGWFRTGDRAVLDGDGHLCLAGRSKEVVNINGVKVPVADVQLLLEQAVEGRGGVARLVVFPSRAAGAHTEQVTVAYVPARLPDFEPESGSNEEEEEEAAEEIERLLVQACLLATASRPLVFALGRASLPLLPTTTLGKISRAKMRALFEEGTFAADVARHRSAVDSGRLRRQEKKKREKKETAPASASEEEARLLEDFARVRDGEDAAAGEMDPDTPMWELGFTSMTLIRLKHAIDKRLGITLPVVALMKNPTARALAAVVSDLVKQKQQQQPNGHTPNGEEKDAPAPAPAPALPPADGTLDHRYDPVVTFRASGRKAPLWLVHPGVGEVLVFAGLARHLGDDDRPVYALRARGFEPGESRFGSVSEAADAYAAAVRRRQPRGPYALAGYSYGAMLAFEMAKRLGSEGEEEVRFLGCFNLPPHIKTRMRHLNWNLCLLNLAYFVGLISEARAARIERLGYDDGQEDGDEGEEGDGDGKGGGGGGSGGGGFRELASRSQALGIILGAADPARLAELGLGEPELTRWADVAHGLQHMASDYEPGGLVDAIDVFHAVPLRVVAASREAWLRDHLAHWRHFCRREGDQGVRFHAVGGAHYTMIGPDHVAGFATVLKAALRDRGV